MVIRPLARRFCYGAKRSTASSKSRSLGKMDLETKSLERFDRLVESGDIMWEENDVRIVKAEPFDARNVSPSKIATRSYIDRNLSFTSGSHHH